MLAIKDAHLGLRRRVDAAYSAHELGEVKEFSGFDLGAWVKKNVVWKKDLAAEFLECLRKGDLAKYLTW